MGKNYKNAKLYFLLICGIFLLSFTNIVNVSSENGIDEPIDFRSLNSTVDMYNTSDGVITSGESNILYWVQISDIHLSPNERPEDIEKLKEFGHLMNTTIKPAFIMDTGDFVEAENRIQQEVEYQIYTEFINQSGYNKTNWYASIGNHEIYNTAYNHSLYNEYIREQTQFAVDVNTSFGIYRFISVDTTQMYGLKFPFSFFGDLNDEKYEHLEKLAQYGDTNSIEQYFLVGHNPMNQLFPGKNNLEKFMIDNNIQAYLSGHLHQENLYADRENFIEAGIPSFKDKHFFRICAFDDNVFSFTEEVISDNPYVLITSPTDARFNTKSTPIDNVYAHDYIHTLIFNQSTITSAYIKINGENIGDLVQSEETNLWVLDFDKSEYATGIHTIVVHVETEDGGITEKEMKFSLSGDTYPLDAPGLQFYFRFPFNQLFITIALILTFFSLINPIASLFYYFYTRHRTSPPNGKWTKMWWDIGRMPLFWYLMYWFIAVFTISIPFSYAEMGPGEMGFLGIYGINIGGTYVRTPFSLVFSFFFFGISIMLQIAFVKGYRHKKFTSGTIESFIATFLILGIIFGANAFFFGYSAIYLSPGFWGFLIPTIAFMIKIGLMRKSESKSSESNLS